MDNYKEILTELNDIIVKISDFEKELIANKEKADYSILKTKECLDNQILQFKENKENFQTSIQLIEDKYKNIIKDIHNKIETDFQEIINDKLDRIKSVLYPLEIELKEYNGEISRFKNFIDNDLRNEFIKNQNKIEENNKELIRKLLKSGLITTILVCIYYLQTLMIP